MHAMVVTFVVRLLLLLVFFFCAHVTNINQNSFFSVVWKAS